MKWDKLDVFQRERKKKKKRMLICEPGYANPHLSSASEKKVTTLCKEQV
jgi:lactate dehydrogenase-like 2-hydroxyacid dehydrogenase